MTLQMVTGVQDPRAAERAKLQAAKEKARAELASKGRMVPAKPPVPRAKTGAKSNILQRADVVMHPLCPAANLQRRSGFCGRVLPTVCFSALATTTTCLQMCHFSSHCRFLLSSVCTVANGAAHAKLERRPVAPAVNPWEARRLKALSESGPEQLPNGHAAAPAAAPPAAPPARPPAAGCRAAACCSHRAHRSCRARCEHCTPCRAASGEQHSCCAPC